MVDRKWRKELRKTVFARPAASAPPQGDGFDIIMSGESASAGQTTVSLCSACANVIDIPISFPLAVEMDYLSAVWTSTNTPAGSWTVIMQVMELGDTTFSDAGRFTVNTS